jgi:hypothetical protein
MILGAVIGRTPNATGWVRINCPVCQSRKGTPDRRVSFGYRPKTGGFKCFRCGVRGRMEGDGYVLPEVADAEQPPDEVDLTARADFYPLWDRNGWTSLSLAPAREYMLNRGITREHMRRADVHAAVGGKYADRVIVPHKDRTDRWWGFTSRLIFNPPKDGPPKVLYPKGMDRSRMYNDQALDLVTDTPVLLVEGCLDAIWYLPDAVAALGKPTAAHFGALELCRRPLVICLDGDAWEEGRALAKRLQLRGVAAASVRLPPTEDPQSIDPDWLRAQAEEKSHAIHQIVHRSSEHPWP